MKRRLGAFTLLEVLTVALIVGILTLLVFAGIARLQARAQRMQCMANLRSLYSAAELLVQQNGAWPQIARTDSETGGEEFARAWIDALAPFGTTPKTWICPTMEQLLKGIESTQADSARIDYIPMSFDDKPITPHQWPQQPWFIETGDVHGSGNLIIFTDGSIGDLKTVMAGSSASR